MAEQHDRALSLGETYKRQSQNTSFRSSAVFPVILGSEHNTVISLLNYWLLKNEIDTVVVDYRIYDGDGELVKRNNRMMTDGRVLNVDLKEELAGVFDVFTGSIHVDILSCRNLRFSFPGINCYIYSPSNMSAVHSAGRVRNPDEAQNAVEVSETNWTGVNRPGYVPFVHLFNGGLPHEEVPFQVELRDSNNELIHSYEDSWRDVQPFASRIVKLSTKGLKDATPYYYPRVRYAMAGIYPRLVVGMIDEKSDTWFITHTTPVVEKDNDVVESGVDDGESRSWITTLNGKEFLGKLVFFPSHPDVGPVDIVGGNENQNHQIFPSRASGKLQVIEDTGDVVYFANGTRVPSRWHVNYLYSVAGHEQFADVATQVSNRFFPKKQHHWGFGVVSVSCETVLSMHLHVSPEELEGPNLQGVLSIYDESGLVGSEVVRFDRVDFMCLKLRGLVPRERLSEKPTHIGWMLKLDHPLKLRGNWVSYGPDGRICGDHFI